MNAELAQARINAIVEARVEKRLPAALMDAVLPYLNEIAELKARKARLEVDLAQAIKQAAFWSKRYQEATTVPVRDEWARRRDIENGRKRYSPCIDCGEESRGLRCMACAAARR